MLNKTIDEHYYEVLGVAPQTSFKEIHKAYKKLANQFQDERQQAATKFADISNAYQVLIDPLQRFQYDAQRDVARGFNDYYNDSSYRQSEEQREVRSTHTSSPRSVQLTVFGIRKYDGQPCKRCLMQGTYCYQHTDQDPSRRTERSSHPQRPHDHQHRSGSKSIVSNHGQTVFGLRKSDGQPCKRCLMQGTYCYQHKDQDPKYRLEQVSRAQRSLDHQHRSGFKSCSSNQGQTVFGLRKSDGQPCKRCMMQGAYCYQHKHQAPAYRPK